MAISHEEGPDYDVEIDADELLETLAEDAAHYGEDYEEKRRWWFDSFEAVADFPEARIWMLEARAAQEAYSEVLAALQPESRSYKCFREEDGSVDVRGLMSWVSEKGDQAHERRNQRSKHALSAQASKAESAYSSILSTLRDDFGVGWPRLDVGGNPIPEDQP